jgi:hypothetical protein
VQPLLARLDWRPLVACLACWVACGLLAERALGTCRSHACWQRLHERRVEHWLRSERPWLWQWRRLAAWERSWVRCVANAETRGFPWRVKATVATGNGYYGSTQWLPATWHAAGGSGLPTQHSLHEQLVRTVWWAHRAGPGQWSTSAGCGW